MLTVASCLSATERPSVARSAVVPALWAGLAAASKYTLGLVFLPVLIGIWMYQDRDRRLVFSGVAMATVCLTFLAAVPYALLDLPAFLNGLAFDAWHYRTGHVGFDDEPGLSQLRYYVSHFTTEFGRLGAVLAIIGSVAALRRDWRRSYCFSHSRLFSWRCCQDSASISRGTSWGSIRFTPVAVGYGFVILHGWCVRRLVGRSGDSVDRLGR